MNTKHPCGRPTINNSQAVQDFRREGGGILHMRPEFDQDRGLTLAFKVGRRHVQVATALQHKADNFTKKIGTKLALERFANGQSITLPLTNPKDAVFMLKTVFGAAQGW